MLFTEKFAIIKADNDDWFDPILSIDTRLFIDPFLLYQQETGAFAGSHQEVVAFFNAIFQLIAESTGNTGSLRYKQAVDALRFPEVDELCLGYTAQGTGGAGGGGKTAKVIAAAIWEAIQAGLTQITHFEEVAILRDGIGADRISDATAGLLRSRLVKYTQDVCERHSIPTTKGRHVRGQFSLESGRWQSLNWKLPISPYTKRPILLVPEMYLRPLPTINPDDFWDYCYDNENDTIRREFSQDITRNVSKRDIVRLARRHVNLLSKYVRYREKRKTSSYDLEADPKGLVKWYIATKSHVDAHPLELVVRNQKQFCAAIEKMLRQYKHYVEECSGWSLLWNDNHRPKDEKAAQHLFLGIVSSYCEANDIDVSREPNIGRGPVDFKVSRGNSLRVLFELKLAKNTKFWSGLTKQLPTYQNAEGINLAYFVVVCYSDKDFEKVRKIREVVEEVNAATGYEIRAVVVDARRDKPSASKL